MKKLSTCLVLAIALSHSSHAATLSDAANDSSHAPTSFTQYAAIVTTVPFIWSLTKMGMEKLWGLGTEPEERASFLALGRANAGITDSSSADDAAVLPVSPSIAKIIKPKNSKKLDIYSAKESAEEPTVILENTGDHQYSLLSDLVGPMPSRPALSELSDQAQMPQMLMPISSLLEQAKEIGSIKVGHPKSKEYKDNIEALKEKSQAFLAQSRAYNPEIPILGPEIYTAGKLKASVNNAAKALKRVLQEKDQSEAQ